MDAPLADTPDARPDRSHGTRYSAEIRELARQLWSFRHGRNAEAVAAALGTECPGIEGRTIRRWATDGGWAERAAADLAALAPDLHAAIVADLIAGAAEGAQCLRAIARGEAKAEAPRVNAAVALLGFAGFDRAKPEPLRPIAPAAADFAAMSTDDLAALEAELVAAERQR